MSVDIVIPGRGTFHLTHVVSDVNGTVAAGEEYIEGVREQLLALPLAGWEVHLITADTRGRQSILDAELGWPALRIGGGDRGGEAARKAAFVRHLGADGVVAIGNGSNDASMLREAALGIAVLGPEGLSLDALLASDVITSNIRDALSLLQDTDRLVATLRG